MKEKTTNTGIKARKRRKRPLNDTNTVFARVLILPSLAGVLTFFVIPFIIVVYYSFVDNPITKQFVGIENYKLLFKSIAFVRAAKNTAALSFTAVPLAVVLSLMLAALLDSKIPGKSTLRSFFLSPMMVPVASVVLIWRVVFAYKGTLNAELMRFFEVDDLVKALGAMPLDWLKSPKCLIVVSLLFLWKNLGYNMVLFLSALNNIPKDLIEVAELEGASALWRMIFIKMRYLSPTVLFVTILSLINSFKLFREIYLLTGANPYEGIYMLQHFMNNTFLTLDYQKLSSAAIVMSIVMVIIIGILFTTESLFGHDVEE